MRWDCAFRKPTRSNPFPWEFGERYLPFFGEGFLATILLVRRHKPEPSAPLLSCRRSPGRSCVSCAGLLLGGSLLWDPRGGAVRLCDVDDGAANRRDHLGGDMQLMRVAATVWHTINIMCMNIHSMV